MHTYKGQIIGTTIFKQKHFHIENLVYSKVHCIYEFNFLSRADASEYQADLSWGNRSGHAQGITYYCDLAVVI